MDVCVDQARCQESAAGVDDLTGRLGDVADVLDPAVDHRDVDPRRAAGHAAAANEEI
jgi:hypothetical protein